MKTRKGFVSNSSSASFVVHIDMEPISFLQDLIGHFDFSFLDKKGFINTIKEDIIKFEEYIKQAKDNKPWTSDLETHIKIKNKILKRIPKMKDLELAEAVLNYNHIFMAKRRNCCELSSHTIMYNNSEDVPQVLQAIICHLAINHKGKYDVTAESD